MVLRIVWDTGDRAAWDDFHAVAAAPLQQDWAYGAALAQLGATCHRALVYEGAALVACAQFVVRRVACGVHVALCTRGPVFAPAVDDATRTVIVRRLRRTAPWGKPRFTFMSPEAVGDGAYAGRWRVMTGYSTVMLDLTRPAVEQRRAMTVKWRNRLVAAERSRLKIETVGQQPVQYQWLLAHEAKQRSARGYRALPLDFIPAFQRARGAAPSLLTVRADFDRRPAAAMLYLIHGTAATYHVGWSGEEGRRLGAHNLLLWEAMSRLAAHGVRRLDLGGVNTQSSAGVARFKLGAGGEVVTLAGTWL